MSSAIVLINTQSGTESKLVEDLGGMKEVEAAYLVYGVYDIAIKVTTESAEALDSFLMQKVRSLPGIKSTLTLLVSKSYQKA